MDKREQATVLASFGYSVNMLRLLLNMALLTPEEYARIIRICADHYGVGHYYV